MTESPGTNGIGACETMVCQRSAHITHVPSMQNYSEVCLRIKLSLCGGSWPPPRIRFLAFPVCHHDGFTNGKIRKEAHWQMMFADDVVLCARDNDGLQLTLIGAVEGSLGEERNESVKGNDRVHVPEWNAIRKC